MKTVMVNIRDAKTNLSAYARRVKKGERFVLCDRNKPFAEIRPLAGGTSGRRPFGLAKGVIHLPDDFNKPDREIEALFGAG